jgi:hypothetical protein
VIAFQKSRTADINAPYQDIYECGTFVWLNLAQQEHFTSLPVSNFESISRAITVT